jgi:hypothetical protein
MILTTSNLSVGNAMSYIMGEPASRGVMAMGGRWDVMIEPRHITGRTGGKHNEGTPRHQREKKRA